MNDDTRIECICTSISGIDPDEKKEKARHCFSLIKTIRKSPSPQTLC